MRRKLQSIQALRALAALLIVGDHAIYYLAHKQDVPQPLQNLAWFLGAFGVGIFFVISGFIMIYTSRDLAGTRFGYAKFAYRRIVRIVPLYWLATFVAAGLLLRHQFPSNFAIVSSLAFIPVVMQVGEPLRPILGVGWTLNLEMFFYTLFTVSLLFPRRVGISTLVAFLVLLVAAGGLLKPLDDTNDPITTLTFLSSPILLLFAGGVVLGAVIGLSEQSTFSVPFGAAISIALIGASVAVFILCVDRAPWPFGWQIVFWTLCLVIVLLAVITVEARQWRVMGMLELLGDASYSIYLFHFLVIAAVGRVWLMAFGGIAPLPFLTVAFVVAGSVGLLIHLWVERPLLQTLRHLQPILSRLVMPLSPS